MTTIEHADVDPSHVDPSRVDSSDADAVDAADAALLDESWTAPRRTSRVTVVLAAGLVAALGFAGGAYAQRSHDQGLTPVAAGRVAAGGFGGALAGGQLPSGFPSGGFGGAGNGAGQGGTTAASSPPVVVGTVTAIHAADVTVKNFAGAGVVVHVPSNATVTTTGAVGLTIGSTVAVSGTKGADGSVTATSIVSRRAG